MKGICFKGKNKISDKMLIVKSCWNSPWFKWISILHRSCVQVVLWNTFHMLLLKILPGFCLGGFQSQCLTFFPGQTKMTSVIGLVFCIALTTFSLVICDSVKSTLFSSLFFFFFSPYGFKKIKYKPWEHYLLLSLTKCTSEWE